MKKNFYTEPLCQVIELELEGTLCDSLIPSGTKVPNAAYGKDLWD